MARLLPSALPALLLASVASCGDQDPVPVERVATGFRFVEGPAWNATERSLWFSDISADRILKLGPDGEVTTWLEPSGQSNGLVFDARGRLHACLGGDRQVVRFERDGTRTVVAESFDSKRLNSPNDLALDPDGGLWFTDPRYGDTTGVEQDRMAVYWIDPSTGELRRVVDDIARPNGILVSRDGSGLYVADPNRRALRYYPILGPGVAGAGKDLFVGDPDLDGVGPDGMAVDRDGRIYTTYEGVNVHEPDGTLIRRIPIPERPANCAFGGEDLRDLYVTARTSLYRVRLEVPGVPPIAPPEPSTFRDADRFRTQVLDDAIGIGYGVAVADVDGDGAPDVVLVDQDDVAWYRNPGTRDGTWTRHVVAHRLSGHLHHVCVAARDLDGDGRAELAAGAAWNPSDTEDSGSVFWLEPVDDRTGPWTPEALHREPTVHRMRWVRAREGFELVVAPLHGRGNVDGQGAGVRILAYRRAPDGTWSTSVVDADLHVTHNLDPVQWDDDPEEELLVAAREGVFLLDRGADGEPWQRTAIVTPASDPLFRGASEVRGGRLPDGQRFVTTVEPFHGATACVYVPPEDGAPRSDWVRRVLPGDARPQSHALATGDLLGVGHDQVVLGWRNPDASGLYGVVVFDPADPAFRSCTATRITLDMACEDLRLADLDADGDLDVVACGRATHDLRVFWNDGD